MKTYPMRPVPTAAIVSKHETLEKAQEAAEVLRERGMDAVVRTLIVRNEDGTFGKAISVCDGDKL